MTIRKQIRELLAVTEGQAKQVHERLIETGIDINYISKAKLHLEIKIAANDVGVLVRKHVK